MSWQVQSQNSLLSAIRGSHLLVLTTLGAVDGTIFLMAASGALSHLQGALVAGLTVVGGAGAWLTAQEEFGSAPLSGAERIRLATIAAVAVGATLLAAALGAYIAGAVQLVVLPKAAGLVLLIVAVEIAGVDLPKLRGLPLAVVALVGAIVLEVTAWIL